VNYQDFYQNNPKEYIVKRGKKKSFRIPVIDENWQFYSHALKNIPAETSIHTAPTPAASEASAFKKGFKRTLLQLKALVKPSTIICGQRGNTLCAVYEKKD
jgi:hypothetical protein